LTEELKKSTAQADLIMALMDYLNIEKLPVLAASGAGVIGIRMAIQYPDRIQALCLCCATTGSFDHPLYDMFNKGTGKSAMESPTLSYYVCKNMPKYMAAAIATERMTANKI
jgi:pimeloyl-ACP methyl ester carboxylesterase